MAVTAASPTRRGAARSVKAPRVRAAGKANTSTSADVNTAWQMFDGWLRDPAIRNFFLQVLALLVGGVVTGLAIATAMATGAVGTVLTTVLPTTFSKVAAGAAVTTVLGSSYWLRQRSRATGTARPVRAAR